jgi:hypothetical protein
MKKIKIILIIFIVSICGLALGIFIYLNVPRKIKIYGEYKQVYSKKETSGILWSIIENEDVRLSLEKVLEIDIPKINFNKYYLLWSDGRKIKEINYKIGSKFKWCFNEPKGIEVAENNHYPHTAFFYLIEKVFVKQDED